MPELPEVETIVRQLRPGLVGRRIVTTEIPWPRAVARPGPADFARGLAGRRVTALRRRGKFFVLDLDDGCCLAGHLRMTGRLLLERGPAPPYARVRLGLDDGRHLTFADVRKFGRLFLVSRLEDATGPLGPEPLEPAFGSHWLARALAARRRRLKPLLLDQSFLAGLGNIYVDEALHRSGLHPLLPSHRLGAVRAARLAAAIQAVLRRAIAAEGSSFDAFYRTPEGRPGSFQEQFAVYGREGRPCRRCARPIVRIVVGQRGTWLCRRCQPAPRPQRVRA